MADPSINERALKAAENALMACYGERFDIMARKILEAAVPQLTDICPWDCDGCHSSDCPCDRMGCAGDEG